jgi:hypothetical protein
MEGLLLAHTNSEHQLDLITKVYQPRIEAILHRCTIGYESELDAVKEIYAAGMYDIDNVLKTLIRIYKSSAEKIDYLAYPKR